MTASPQIFAIPGIRDNRVHPTWPWAFRSTAARLGIVADVDAHHYAAGPWPRWNKFAVNPPIAKRIANQILLRREILGRGQVHLLAHSNGCVIALSVAQRLAKAGVPVETLVLIGAALHSNIDKSGLQDLGDRRMLNRAVSYYSPDDGVIKHLQTFPGAYGSLGARGFELGSRQPVGFHVVGYGEAPPFADFVNRRFEGFGHSEYFSAPWADATFTTALRDMGFDVAPY